ncbi:MAG: ABC transporter permease [Deltaproteobacteria bacterium]|nr:ABC transporter permease [Deltaproteobacteria bacterium]
MHELNAIVAVWRREFIVFRREVSRVVSSIVSPLMWLFLFGAGVGGTVEVGGEPYQAYIFPGIVIMATLFTSMFYGVYIIWDRKIDVLKAVLVAPVSRVAIFFGKVLGGCTDALLQSVVLLLVGLFFVSYTPLGLLAAAGIVFLTAIAFVALGLGIGALFESLEGFQLIGTFIVFPLFFLSGALYRLDSVPGWLRVLSRVDPVTYAVDALRGVMLGRHVFPIALDVAILAGFAALTVLAGSLAFGRMK